MGIWCGGWLMLLVRNDMFLVEGGGVMIVMLLFVVVGIVGVFDMFVLK